MVFVSFIYFFLFFTMVKELHIYDLWQAAAGISFWLRDKIVFYDLCFPQIYFYIFKKRKGKKKERKESKRKEEKGGECSFLSAHSILVLERNLKSRRDRKGLFDSFSRSQSEAFGVNSASLDLWEPELCSCGSSEPGIMGEISLLTLSSELALQRAPSQVFLPRCFILYRIHTTSNKPQRNWW